jgi:hypothetical protein
LSWHGEAGPDARIGRFVVASRHDVHHFPYKRSIA